MTKPKLGDDMRNQPKWTEQQDADLRRLLAAHCSFSEASSQINADYGTSYSRNAAIGRAHRLGIKSERAAIPGAGRKATGRKPRVRNFRPAMTFVPLAAVEVTPEPAPFAGSLKLPFGDLRMFSTEKPNQCRFIEGASPDFSCCGNETLPGAAWCGHHHVITHAVDERRRFKVTGNRRGMKASNFSGSFEPA